MAKVNIDGQEFTLSSDKAQDLMQWLVQNGGVKVESTGGEFEGQQLLNEQTPRDQMKDRDPASPPKGEPNKTWDMGTPWIEYTDKIYYSTRELNLSRLIRMHNSLKLVIAK